MFGSPVDGPVFLLSVLLLVVRMVVMGGDGSGTGDNFGMWCSCRLFFTESILDMTCAKPEPIQDRSYLSSARYLRTLVLLAFAARFAPT